MSRHSWGGPRPRRPWSGGWRRAIVGSGSGPLIAFSLIGACNKNATEWTAFNADGDSVQVEVTADATAGDAVSTDLHSTTGSVVVGTATVDPGSGPVGTDHTVTVDVVADYADEVGKVTLSADGDRGTDDIDLVQDSADHGLWQRIVTSNGEDGETRTDTFTFHLFSETSSASSDSDGS